MIINKYNDAYKRLVAKLAKCENIEDLRDDLNVLGGLVNYAEDLAHKNAKLYGRVGGLQTEIERLRHKR